MTFVNQMPIPEVRDTWFGIEKPFPWLPITFCAIPILIIAFAVVLGIVLC